MADSETPQRDENGRLLPGYTANPEGKNGYLKGWQRYGDRLQKWLHLPGEEIAALFHDQKALNKLSTIDIACVRQAVVILGGEGWLEALERGLDRIEGKPTQAHRIAGDPNNQTPIALDGTFTLVFGTDGNDSDKA